MSYVLKKNYIEAGLQATSGVSGHYRITAHKLDGRSRVVADWFENLILDTGLIQMGLTGFITSCSVGTGNAEPVTTQTSLQSLLATTTTKNTRTFGVNSGLPYYGWSQVVFRFPVGAAAGNISEVGVGWTASNLFSRSLIKDVGGNPTSINILSDEVLDVTYQLRQYAPASDVTQVINVSGTNHTVTIRPYMAASSRVGWDSFLTTGDVSSMLGQVACAITGNYAYMSNLVVYDASHSLVTSVTSIPYNGTTNKAYNSASSAGYMFNSTYLNDKVARGGVALGLNDGNFSEGIALLTVPTVNLGHYQVGFNPPILKTASHTLRVDLTIGWDRYTPV